MKQVLVLQDGILPHYNGTIPFFGYNVTNDSGYYNITSVPYGTFWLNETLKAGWTQVTATRTTQRRNVGLREQMRYDYLVRLFGGELRRDYIERRYGKAFWLYLGPELLAMRALGATRHDPDAIRLTHRGMYCWVLMMAEFFNSVNAVREQMREHIRTELDAWNEEATVPVSSITKRPQEART